MVCPSGNLINYTCETFYRHCFKIAISDPVSFFASTGAVAPPYEISLHCYNTMPPKCLWWDRKHLEWSGKGCEQVGVVQTGVDVGYTICNCSHLTDFTTELTESRQLTAEIVPIFFNFATTSVIKNILILITLLVVYSLTVAGCFYAHYLNYIETKKIVPVKSFDVAVAKVKGTGYFDCRPECAEYFFYHSLTRVPLDDAGGSTISEGLGEMLGHLNVDYGQHPDSLTPHALSNRILRTVARWRAYQQFGE